MVHNQTAHHFITHWYKNIFFIRQMIDRYMKHLFCLRTTIEFRIAYHGLWTPNKSQKSENLGRWGRQNMLRPYLQNFGVGVDFRPCSETIWGICSPCPIAWGDFFRFIVVFVTGLFKPSVLSWSTPKNWPIQLMAPN